MLSFLPLSVPFGCFQPSFTFEGLAHVSPDRESVSAACACAHNAKGQAEMEGEGAWVFTVPLSGLPSNFHGRGAAKHESR